MMKLALTAAVGLLAIGATATDAQIRVAARDVPPGHRPPPGMCRIWIDGVPPGRQPRPTDCATARARAPRDSRIIYGDRTSFPGQGRESRRSRDCEYERSQTTLGDIIFGRRSGDVDCRYDDRRDLGSWYEVGRDRNGVIYQRRVRLRDGTVVVQRARRDRSGRMVVFDTRYPRSGIDRAGRDDDDVWSRSDRERSRDRRIADDRRRGNNKASRSNRGNGRGKGRN
ncbi:MAG TPA: hypothetical protein VMM17_01290 [Gemmatimonadaceae bacterium]|nr:hypothetical protein [Gemmatimonadaceae bacterium]